MQPEIISMGEPIIEFAMNRSDFFSDKESIDIWGGGDTSNFAIAASRLGAKVGYLTRIGNDYFGNELMKLWLSENIDTAFIEIDNLETTGISFIEPKTRKNLAIRYRLNSAAAKMTPAFIPRSYIQDAKLIHVSGTSQAISGTACDSIFTAIKTAIEAERLVSYSPNLSLEFWSLERAKAVIHETISLTDILFIKIDDAKKLTGFKNHKQIADFYIKFEKPKIVVLKLEGGGHILATKDMIDGFYFSNLVHYDPFEVNSIDFSGYDDSFDAAFVVAYISGKKLEECCRFALAAAALTTKGHSCVKPLPNTSEVNDFLQIVLTE